MDKLKHQIGDIKQKGFGIIPKLVMQDTRLSIEAKAIYAYMASYAGAGDTAFPGVELMKDHLGVSEKRFYKYRKELVDFEYITIVQTRNEDGNRRGKNIYTLNQILPQSQHSQNDSIENFEHSRFESVQTESVQIEHVQNEGTNNNSLLKLTVLNNNSVQQQQEKESVVVEKEIIQSVMEMVDKKVDYQSAKVILEAANNELSVIKEKYQIAKATGYRNLGGWMVKAIKEDWQMPRKQDLGSEKKSRNSFHNFEQRSSKYTNEELERMLRKNKRQIGGD